MKKLSILCALIGVTFFASCDKEEQITSLEGTTWMNGNKGGLKVELAFTATHATITETFDWGGVETFTGTYTFDPPVVLISGDVWISDGMTLYMPYEMVHKGTIKGHTMEISIQAYDMFMHTFLKLQ